MKLKRIWLVGLSSLLIASCATWQEKDVEKNGIHFKKFRQEKLHFGEEGKKVLVGVIEDDMDIYGYPVKQGMVVFYEDWHLKEFALAKPYTINGIPFPADTWVFPADEGYVKAVVFPKNMQIQGHTVRGGKGGPEGVVTTFYEDGNLKSFFSREDVIIDDIPCKGSVFRPIVLYDTGELKSCTLAYPATIAGIAYTKNTRLTLDKTGEISASK